MSKTLYICILLALSFPVLSDIRIYKQELKKDYFEFGEVKVIRIRDTTRSAVYPEWSVEIYRQGELVASHKGISFQDIAANKENNLFLGISNTGFPATALIAFDSQGNIKLNCNHNENSFKYCKQSAYAIKEWYNSEKPGIQFKGISPTKIEVNGCDGQIIEILLRL